MATLDDDDLQAIQGLMDQTITERINDGALASGKAVSHVPSKDEFFDSQDEQMTELKAIRENQSAQSKQISRNSDRIEKLEKIHPDYKHHSSN